MNDSQSNQPIRDTIVTAYRSPLFLATTVSFTVAFVCQLLSGTIAGLLPAIFMLIALIGMWKCYIAATNGEAVGKTIRQAALYDAYTRVMYTISIVLLSIAAVIGALLIFVGGELLSTLLDGESSGTFVAVIVFLVIMAISITIVALYRSAFAHRRAFFIDLAYAAESDKYRIARVPLFGSWFIGICSVLGTAGPLVVNALKTAALQAINDLLAAAAESGDMADAAEAIEQIEVWIEQTGSSMTMSAVGSLAIGAYYILCAIWMASVHKAGEETRARVAAEAAQQNNAGA